MNGIEFILLCKSAILTAVGAAGAFAAARSGRRTPLRWARLFCAVGTAESVLVLLSVGLRLHRFPVGNVGEAFIFFAAAVMAAALALDALRGLPILILGTAPLASLLLLLPITLALRPMETAAGTPDASFWTHLHTFIALGAFGAFALAFVTGILYLVGQRRLKEHSGASLLGLMPSLETVARINVRSIGVGVALLTGGLLVGYLRARNLFTTEGSGWRMDPKILLTTLTLVVYFFVLVASARPAFKGRRTALGSVLGFFLTLATFWASVFWSDFHRYR